MRHLHANRNRRNSVVLVHSSSYMISGFARVPLMLSDVSTSISPYLLSAEQQVDCPGPVGARLTKTVCLLFPEYASFITQLPVLHKLSKFGGMPTASTPAMQSSIQNKTHLHNHRAIRVGLSFLHSYHHSRHQQLPKSTLHPRISLTHLPKENLPTDSR